MTGFDQAEGLRRWARSRSGQPGGERRAGRILVVVGLADGAGPVTGLLQHWADQGRRWIGDPADWRVVAMEASSPHVPLLAAEQPRWGLWVNNDRQGFRTALRHMQLLHRQNGPSRLLALHDPSLSRRGLLGNLQQSAADYFGMQLLVLAK